MFAVRRYGQSLVALALLCGALAAIALSPAPSDAASECRTFTLDKTERLQFTELDNASGLVASRAMPGVFWAHNDQAGVAPNSVFAIDDQGRHLATIDFQLSGSNQTVPGDFVDIEDIAIGPGPDLGADYLYLGDIGNNTTTSREEVAVYRFREPLFVPDPGSAPQTLVVSESGIDAQRFTYQWFKDLSKTHQRNAEGIFVDPEGGDLYIFEKGTHSLAEMFPGNPDTTPMYSHVYKIDRPKLFYGNKVRTANIVGYIQHIYDGQPSGDGSKVTGADISHDGRLIVVRNGEKAFYWYRAQGQTIKNVFELDHAAPCLGPDGTKGEAVAILADGSAFYGLREGSTQPLSPVFKAEISGYGLPECNGLEATSPDHVGTPGDDLITGTDGPDVIVAFGGNDTINAGKGNDVICAGSGNDVVNGGGGNDVIFGRAGRDRLNGGFGDDKIYGGIHGDTIKAGWGNDLAVGGEHPDSVYGNKGVDEVRGDKGDDVVRGGQSNDIVKGNVGDDSLFGGYGTDSCDGGGGFDSASGCENEWNVP